jgi:integrase
MGSWQKLWMSRIGHGLSPTSIFPCHHRHGIRRYNKPEDFVFPSERLRGSKPLDLASVLKKKIQPAFRRIGITGVGWHTFRHSVGTMLAEMGEHQLTIRDYLRHSNLHVTNKYLQATSKTKRLAQDKLVDAILPTGILPKTSLIQ